MIRIVDASMQVDTPTLTAVLTNGFLTSFRSKDTGREWISPFDPAAGSAVEVVYDNGQTAGFGPRKPVTVSLHLVSDATAEFRFHGWDADAVLRVSVCPESGDLVVEPSAYAARSGVKAARWNLPGMPGDADLVAPIYQGIRLPLTDPLIRNLSWNWPIHWEAGFAVMQAKTEGFVIRTDDTSYRYKTLRVGNGDDPMALAVETDAYGPLDASLGAGGLVWRLAPYRGDWTVPATAYRSRLWQAYGLDKQEARRPEWLRDLRFAVSWYNGDPDVLDALARKVDPKRTLIHFSQWRTDGYDENYPTYTASRAGRHAIEKARAMGYHIMPHCNAIDMDPSHPAYAFLRDFEYRDLIGKGRLGWGYEAGKGILSVPNSNAALVENRHRKVMVKIHPGLAMWRSILAEHIREGIAGMDVDGVFIDVTLCSFNIHNCLVENTTPTEGMKRIIEHIGEINGGIAVGGEGLNEITMQGLSCAQAHLFRSHHASCEGLERAGGCPVNDFLFGTLCRTFGYSRLSGKTDEEVMRSRVHLSLGAIPTVTGLSAADIDKPTPHVRELFDMAAG